MGRNNCAAGAGPPKRFCYYFSTVIIQNCRFLFVTRMHRANLRQLEQLEKTQQNAILIRLVYIGSRIGELQKEI